MMLLRFLMGCCCFPAFEDYKELASSTPPATPTPISSQQAPLVPIQATPIASPAWVEGPSTPLPTPVCQVEDASFCQAVSSIQDVAWSTSRLDAGVNPNCPCHFEIKQRKLVADIPLVKHFVQDKYRNYTVVQTPLYIAVYFNSQPLTELLLKRGAHPDLPGPTGDTPMMAALQYEDRLELAKMLVAAGASIKKIDLGLVDTAETAQALIQQGANPQTLDIQLLQNNQKLLGWFLSQHPDLTDESADIAVTLTPETVDALLSAGMPTTISGTFDPFLILAIEKQEELVPVLLKHHADPEAKGSFDQTALCKAADTGKVASAKALLAAGAKVNANCSNKPPLWAAALSGNQELVDLLIQAGADPNAPVDGKLLLMEMIDDITFFDPGSQLFHGEGKIKVLGNLVARGYTFNVNGQNPCSYTRTKAAAPELIKAACPGSP